MKSSTPCFVLVKGKGKRTELIAWLENVGYNCDTARDDSEHYGMIESVFIVVNGGHCRIQHNRPMLIEEYDCGTDVELFKALAAMNDENDRDQWFMCHRGSGEDFYSGHLFHCDEVYCLCTEIEQRTATAEEIIEHFKTIHL